MLINCKKLKYHKKNYCKNTDNVLNIEFGNGSIHSVIKDYYTKLKLPITNLPFRTFVRVTETIHTWYGILLRNTKYCKVKQSPRVLVQYHNMYHVDVMWPARLDK